MNREQKHALKAKVAESLKKANGAILAEFRGLTVGQLTELRRALREAQSEFKVIKNRVAIKAIEQDVQSAEGLKSSFKGPVGVIYLYGDTAAGTKKVLEFEKSNEKFVVKKGLLDDKAVSPAELKAIADLPPKEVLLARIIGSLIAPHRGLLGVLSGVPRNVVQVINAIKDKKTS